MKYGSGDPEPTIKKRFKKRPLPKGGAGGSQTGPRPGRRVGPRASLVGTSPQRRPTNPRPKAVGVSTVTKRPGGSFSAAHNARPNHTKTGGGTSPSTQPRPDRGKGMKVSKPELPGARFNGAPKPKKSKVVSVKQVGRRIHAVGG